MVNFIPLAAEILSLVWGTPANFNGFRVLVDNNCFVPFPNKATGKSFVGTFSNENTDSNCNCNFKTNI